MNAELKRSIINLLIMHEQFQTDMCYEADESPDNDSLVIEIRETIHKLRSETTE